MTRSKFIGASRIVDVREPFKRPQRLFDDPLHMARIGIGKLRLMHPIHQDKGADIVDRHFKDLDRGSKLFVLGGGYAEVIYPQSPTKTDCAVVFNPELLEK